MHSWDTTPADTNSPKISLECNYHATQKRATKKKPTNGLDRLVFLRECACVFVCVGKRLECACVCACATLFYGAL